MKVVAVEEPIANDGIEEVALIETRANGEVVPKPKRPFGVQEEVRVPVLL